MRRDKSLSVSVLAEERLSLAELSRSCGVSAETVFALVEEGVIGPGRREGGQWRFAAGTLPRLRTALRLQRDLELNPAGAALALELLDELQQLRARVRTLERLLGE